MGESNPQHHPHRTDFQPTELSWLAVDNLDIRGVNSFDLWIVSNLDVWTCTYKTNHRSRHNRRSVSHIPWLNNHRRIILARRKLKGHFLPGRLFYMKPMWIDVRSPLSTMASPAAANHSRAQQQAHTTSSNPRHHRQQKI